MSISGNPLQNTPLLSRAPFWVRAAAPLFIATGIYTIFLVVMQPLYDAHRVPVINPTPMLYGVALIHTPRWHRLWVFPLVVAATFFLGWSVGDKTDYIITLGVSITRATGVLLFVLFLDVFLPAGIDVRRPQHVLALAMAMAAGLALRSYLLPLVVPDSFTSGNSTLTRFIDAFVPDTWKALKATTYGQAAGLLGLVASAPPVLLLTTSRWRWPSLRECLATISGGTLIILLVWFVFNQPSGSLLFLVTVAMVIVTFFFGFFSASLSLLAIGLVALAVQLQNLKLGTVSVLDTETFIVQCFLATTTLVTLLVGAALEQRKLYQARSEADRRAAEEAAATKSRFLATMSHEIRSPLASLTLLTSALRKSTSANDERAESIRIIDSIGHHVLSLLVGVLNYTRFEAVGHTLNRRPTNVSLLIENVVATLLVQAEERGIKLRINTAVAAFDMAIDPERVSQVLINLVGNGVQHAQTRVSVSSAIVGDQFDRLRVTVTDDGPGIPDDTRGHIFEPYFRVEGEARTGRVGLGLAICHEIVTLMGGKIGLDIGSRENTTFWFEIPVVNLEGSGHSVSNQTNHEKGA